MVLIFFEDEKKMGMNNTMDLALPSPSEPLMLPGEEGEEGRKRGKGGVKGTEVGNWGQSSSNNLTSSPPHLFLSTAAILLLPPPLKQSDFSFSPGV